MFVEKPSCLSISIAGIHLPMVRPFLKEPSLILLAQANFGKNQGSFEGIEEMP
jgi:hypothetical protein